MYDSRNEPSAALVVLMASEGPPAMVATAPTIGPAIPFETDPVSVVAAVAEGATVEAGVPHPLSAIATATIIRRWQNITATS
jgi:hypothetical protein